ncbi:uncharacterized protein NPIL_35141 [Nephila pilipes]|uniref:Uncharacterized protein n=1 Tax=Nephila pilipes TaxID=299642 RepID=A0A8X6NGU0_NEPPI|nr:uncharacterized protein NPIL_35141 [Nephila pilipes]
MDYENLLQLKVEDSQLQLKDEESQLQLKDEESQLQLKVEESQLQLKVEESTESKERYRRVKNISDISPVGKVEFEKAKNMLSEVSPKSNMSLYDHLCSILHQILRFGITGAVDQLEDISLALKNKKPIMRTDIIEVTPTNEELSKFVEEKKRFYKLTPVVSMEAIKTAEEDEAAAEQDDEDQDAEEEIEEEEEEEPEEEIEEDESPINVANALNDLHYSMQRFALIGIGLDSVEIHDLYLAMKDVVETYKVEEVKFWGKVFASTCNYYIVESKYNEDVMPEDFGWITMKIQESKEDDVEEEEEEESEEEEKEISEEEVAESKSQEGDELEESTESSNRN